MIAGHLGLFIGSDSGLAVFFGRLTYSNVREYDTSPCHFSWSGRQQVVDLEIVGLH